MPAIGTVHPRTAEIELEQLAARFAPRHGTRPKSVPSRPSNNGWENRARYAAMSFDDLKRLAAERGVTPPGRLSKAVLVRALSAGHVDWAKQERLHRNIGTANVQAASRADGRVVAGAGKGQKDKKK